MQTGTKISGAAHVALILVAIFGGQFRAEPLPFEVAQVSVITAEDFAALSAPRVEPELPQTPPAPEPPQTETVAPLPPEPVDPEPAQQPPEAATVPEAEDAPPVVAPEALEDVRPEAPPQPDDPLPTITETPEPPVDEPARPDVERVAPEVVEETPPDAVPDPVDTPPVTDDPGAEIAVERQEETAPEASTDRIVPDPQDQARLAPTASVRPRTRPDRPEPVETAAPAPEQTEEPRRDAVANALAEALSAPQESEAPSGPPLSAGEKEALRVSVSRCWNVGSLSSAALNTTVVVSVAMLQDGRPDQGSIRMLSHSGGDTSSAQQAFEAARRAIIRCGARGFDLPAEKYAHWRNIEMTFNPERMRIR